jgi:Restriction endonuclease
MSDNPKPWRTYEEVAQYLLNEFAAHFGLGHVEGKQVVPGQSGADWEIDAKGVAVNGEAFVIVECRRRITSKLAQGSVGELAYRIIDTGASGGILVTSLGLQSGAKKVAGHSNIQHVILDPNSTTTEYVLRFLNRTFIGVAETCSVLLKAHY